MSIYRIPRFLRRWIRRNSRPITEEKAWSMKDKLAIGYALIAWNAAGIVLWQMFGKGNIHWPVTAGIREEEEERVRPAIQFAHLLGYQKASVYRISGISMSDKVDFQVDKNLPVAKSFKILNSPEEDKTDVTDEIMSN